MQKQIHDPKIFGKVAVLMGGLSAEREISFMSGNNILQALQRQKVNAYGIDVDSNILSRLIEDKPDRVFIALHGKGGEDGVLQGALEHLNLPYAGSGVAASALAMDKQRSKLLWQALKLPTAEFCVMHQADEASSIIEKLGLPLFVKPICEGSSLGASKVISDVQLVSAFAAAKSLYPAVLVEQYIPGAEYTIGILGEQALPSILITTPHLFYDYEAKYFVDTTQYICPSDLSAKEELAMQQLALAAYKSLGCRGWGRVDFMRDADGRFLILEINTIPGMTDHSLVPIAARQQGISFDDLVWLILEDSFVQRNETPI